MLLVSVSLISLFSLFPFCFKFIANPFVCLSVTAIEVENLIVLVTVPGLSLKWHFIFSCLAHVVSGTVLLFHCLVFFLCMVKFSSSKERKGKVR